MRDELSRILRTYSEAKRDTFERHPTAEFIRTGVTEKIRTALLDCTGASHFIIKGSAGIGKWADSPWIAILDPIVTQTPEMGYYVVYLFSRPMDKVVLSLQLGTTSIKKEFGNSKARSELHRLTEFIRIRVPEYKHFFSDQPINLAPTSDSSRASFYQAAHAFGTVYNADRLSEDKLLLDLRNMVNLYRILTFRGGLSLPDELAKSNEEDNLDTTGIEDPRRYNFHRRIERNRILTEKAKKVLGYICQACDLDFETKYGVIGKGFIEAHHLTPLSKLKEDGPVKLDAKKDFAVLCSNCHRMIHRTGAPGAIDQLKTLIKNHSKKN